MSDPTPEQIAEMCRKIRKSWSPEEYERRRVTKTPETIIHEIETPPKIAAAINAFLNN